MPVGFQAFKEDGTLLFDIDRISYGLLKSGYLNLVDRWGRHYLRSAQLNPAEEANWQYIDLRDPICGITVSGAISPIVFLVGDGKPCGEAISGNVRTLYFQGCTPNTKAFIFDLMRDVGEKSGMECYDATGRISFTTGMPPLNIIAAVDPPAINPPVSPNTDTRWTIYAGSQNEQAGREWSADDYIYPKGAVFVPVVAGELAACLTFSRMCGLTQGTYLGVTQVGASEGCGGASGGVRFFFSPSVATTAVYSGGSSTAWFDIPTDRQPQALVIRATDYPFPFR
ncbi:hypothetical protein [Pseudomonas sp. NBRC 111119]|uniref:hypothetical protein n=1 Tax=Pseudomonas sp. NBRC 111119 TaxID=1661034 RepID=UPI000ADAD866|nr:hypothetical protein [Pseudomonas sp. NBRC 111119]